MSGFIPYLPCEDDTPEFEFGSTKLYKVGIVLGDNPNIAEWRHALWFADICAKSSQFWLGDLLLAGEEYHWLGADYADHSLDNIKSVCRRIEPSRRREELSFDHHATVARLDENEQSAELQFAIDNQLASKSFRAHIAEKYADGNQSVARVICRLMAAQVLDVDYDAGSVKLRLEGAELIEFNRLVRDGKVRVTLMAVDDDNDTD